MSAAERLLPEVLALPPNERAKLVHQLLQSLENASEIDFESSWIEELERRAHDIQIGSTIPIEWHVARDNIMSELRKRRAARHSP
jgi:putative addiction module component (TIGR02574 family)